MQRIFDNIEKIRKTKPMNLINKIIRLSLSRSSVVWHSEAVKNGQPSMYLFDGGFASFNANGAVDGWYYYIHDYMGNNRMVVNSNGTVEQITHYYPYGGVIGDISTNESVQKYKFEGKELDRTFGLDNYDIQARQYFAMMPSWDRIDPLAEKYYGISPYAYCGGDPVNFEDYNGQDTYSVDSLGVIGFTEDKNKTTLVSKSNENSMELSDSQAKMLNDIYNSQKSNGKGHEAIGSANSAKMSKKSALQLFEFLCDNSKVEWSLYYVRVDGKSYYLGTSNNENAAPRYNDVSTRIWGAHYHPDAINGTPGASYAVYYPTNGRYSGGDMEKIIKDYEKWTRDLGKSAYMFPPNYIYHNKKWYFANPWNNSILVPNGINSIGSFNPISQK